jgi:integrase
MAWLQKRGSVYWLGYYVNGKAVRKSLGTSDPDRAREARETFNALSSAKQTGAALEPIYEALSGRTLPRATIIAEVEAWLNEAKRTTSENTHARYKSAADLLLKHVADTPLLKDVTTRQIQTHLDARFDSTSAATANLERKILRVFFKRVTDAGLLKVNPILPIKRYRANGKKRRKPFDIGDLSLAFKAAEQNPFWQYMILAGFYSGQRMGDCITLEIEHVDFQRMMISREMGKTGKIVHIPITPRLAAAIRSQIDGRKSGYVWPQQAAKYNRRGADDFSNEFRDILVDAGLAEKRSHRKKEGNAKGRSVPHDKTGLSFHSLRHSFVTALKRSGATQAVAKALAGHSSDSISDVYTHIPTEALAEAVAKLPEFTQ